jgi:chromate transport protein ChrA
LPCPFFGSTLGCWRAITRSLSLFIAFLKVSLCGFGGGIVWAHRIAVAQRRWVSEEEFADILSLCQFMLGPNVTTTRLLQQKGEILTCVVC